MRTPATFIAATVAAFLLGLSCAAKPDPAEPITPSVEDSPEYIAKVRECDSLSHSLNMALEAKGLAENKLAELQAKPPVTETVYVPDVAEINRLKAELAASRQNSPQAAASCQPAATYQPGYYVPRRGLFGRVR